MRKSLLLSLVAYASVERALFLSLLFFLPFQTRLVLFSEAPFLEWTGAFLYGTDLLVGALLGVWILGRPSFRFSRSDIALVAFLALSALSAVFAEKPYLGTYQFVKLCEMAFIFYYVEHAVRRYNFQQVAGVLVASGFIQALLAIFQFGLQSDLGLYHIEPGPLGAWIRGVANFFSDSGKFIRVYGTFPHPNVLAVFLLGSLTALCGRYSYMMRRSAKDLRFIPDLLHKSYFINLKSCFRRAITDQNLKHIVFWMTSSLLIYALFLTFSRAVIAVGSAGLFGFAVWLVRTKRAAGWTLVVLGATYALVAMLLWPEITSRFKFARHEEAIEFRVSSSESAWNIMKKYPLLGVGPSNYVSHVRQFISDAPRPSEASGEGGPRLKPVDGLQPVHNIFLLIGSETGFLGLLAFLAFLFFTAQAFLTTHPKLRAPLLIFIFVIGAFSLVDHYFWTLQQGRLLWWISWGIIAASGRKP
jgi:O-antigen ligase